MNSTFSCQKILGHNEKYYQEINAINEDIHVIHSHMIFFYTQNFWVMGQDPYYDALLEQINNLLIMNK